MRRHTGIMIALTALLVALFALPAQAHTNDANSKMNALIQANVGDAFHIKAALRPDSEVEPLRCMVRCMVRALRPDSEVEPLRCVVHALRRPDTEPEPL